MALAADCMRAVTDYGIGVADLRAALSDSDVAAYEAGVFGYDALRAMARSMETRRRYPPVSYAALREAIAEYGVACGEDVGDLLDAAENVPINETGRELAWFRRQTAGCTRKQAA